VKLRVLSLIGSLAAVSVSADTSSDTYTITGDALIPTQTSQSETLSVTGTLVPVGMISSSDNLTVVGGITALTDFTANLGLAITTQPAEATTVFAGSPLALTVVATGADPLTYQWSKDGVAIEGAISASFEISAVAADDAGVYTVVVTDPSGSVTSADATVTVLAAPTITGDAVLIVGEALELTAAPQLDGATFAWSKDGTAIEGATAATYSIAAVALSDEGTYSVTITVGEVVGTATLEVSVDEDFVQGTSPLPEALVFLEGSSFVENIDNDTITGSRYSTALGDITVRAGDAAGWVYSSTMGWIFIYPDTPRGSVILYNQLLGVDVFTDNGLTMVGGGIYAYVYAPLDAYIYFPDFNDPSDGSLWIYSYGVMDWVLLPEPTP